EKNIPIFAYSPKEVKLSASGTGTASKNQIAVILGTMLNINIDTIEKDATDALALALCHANRISRCGPDIFTNEPQ
ncbi:MAG: crossover junction endodeoxyribonuclease RuvC, partial [Victivallales bacterium]|nr:crossover junction endodeoxyribonuclease RuvC [Victivallales bacterium]